MNFLHYTSCFLKLRVGIGLRCVILLSVVSLSACEKLVDIPAPATEITTANVFNNSTTAAATLTGIYTSMSQSDISPNGLPSLSLYLGLSADEITLYDRNRLAYALNYTNALVSTNTGGNDYWNQTYPVIYEANAAIEGLTGNTALTQDIQQQLLGEAEFVRAFCYFHLVNIYGDVPLATTTNYKINESMARTPRAQVWQQIITDLKSAQTLMSSNYLYSDAETVTTQRTRPNKWVATALLARAYLYTGDWADAVTQASSIISNQALYSLVGLNSVFLANNNEAIWQLQATGSGKTATTGEGTIFVLPPTGPNISGKYPVYLNDVLANSFEPGDQRRVNWIDSVIVGGNIYYYPFKYKIGAINTGSTLEYCTVFRLAEQYLIRAEAEAEGAGGGLSAAIGDLDVIRSRAGLANLSTGLTQTQVLDTILHERRIELFTEWGHRWFDLKRTGNIDNVMGSPGNACSTKGGTWNPIDSLYPIALPQLQADLNLVQNPGY